MYCYGSKLRSNDMTLRDVAETLEVSLNDISSAVGIPKSTVSHYLDGDYKKPEKLDSISRYLNSREFYSGYSFMPTREFAEFLNKKVLTIFSQKMKQKEIAKAIGMSTQELSKLKKSPKILGKTQKLNVVEQYNILEHFYDMCIGEDGFIPDEYKSLRIELSKYVHKYDVYEIKNSFASLLNSVVDNGFRTQLFIVLKNVCGIQDSKDFNKILHDDEFIMDIEKRYHIIYELDRKIGSFSSVLHKKFKFILTALDFDEEELLNEDFRQIDFTITPLYKYPDIIRRVILDHFYAFVGDAEYFLINRYEKDFFERDYIHYLNIQDELYRINMVEEYHKLSVSNKISVCKDFAGKISEHIKQTGAETTPFKAEFDENGKLVINRDYIYCCQLSDINDIIEIVNRIGPLENVCTNLKNVPIDDEYPFENRSNYLNLLSDDLYYDKSIEEIFDKKLEFDAMDWNLWGLFTQALYIRCSINDIYKHIVKLKNVKKHDFSITP